MDNKTTSEAGWIPSQDPEGRYWETTTASNGTIIYRYGPDHKITVTDKGTSIRFRFDEQANKECKKLGAIWLKDGRWFLRNKPGMPVILPTDLAYVVGPAHDRWQEKWSRPAVKHSA